MDKKFAFAELEKYRKVSTRNYEFSFTKKNQGTQLINMEK